MKGKGEGKGEGNRGVARGSLESGFKGPGLFSRDLAGTIYPRSGGFAGSGVTQNHPEKSSSFKPASRATKVMKISSEATQIYEKGSHKSKEIQFLRKLIFAIPPLSKACFSNPKHPDSDPKINRKRNMGTSMNKHTFSNLKYLI